MLEEQNPWWKGKEWQDSTLKKYESMNVKIETKWINKISFEPFSLNFIFGPRQIGKTTGIKLMIKELLKRKNPYSIFYFNCDLAADISHLKKILDEYLKIKREEKIDSSFIFLDEVTSVEKWWKIIKGYIDLGVFENDVITILGSLSLKIKKEAELFPGRRGKGKDVFVLPLTFKEYAELFNIKKYDEKLQGIFQDYLKTGGFPLAINSLDEAKNAFISSFESEISRINKSLRIAKQIIVSLFRKVPSALSYNAIATDIGISHKTVAEYLDVFEEMFLVKQAFFIENKKPNFRKEKKIFFLDPFIANSFSFWLIENFLDSALYEWVVQSHLVRKFREIYYWRNSYEIDCIADNLKIEIKAGKPHRKYPKGILVLDKEDIPKFLLDF